MSYYPEGLWPQDICHMEGHNFREGGACVRCGEQLRCHICGRYMTIENCVSEHGHPEVYALADTTQGPK